MSKINNKSIVQLEYIPLEDVEGELHIYFWLDVKQLLEAEPLKWLDF
jgi:hypothetical protein